MKEGACFLANGQKNIAKSSKQTAKNRIITATKELFDEKGYDGFTVEDILKLADISRGTFYHYFQSKDDVMIHRGILIDDLYAKWYEGMDMSLDAIDRLKDYNLFILEHHSTTDMSWMKKLYSAHAISRSNNQFYNKNRIYNKISLNLAEEGQSEGIITTACSPYEISKMFSTIQRGIIFDWCVSSGSFVLEDYGCKIMNIFLNGLRTTKK